MNERTAGDIDSWCRVISLLEEYGADTNETFDGKTPLCSLWDNMSWDRDAALAELMVKLRADLSSIRTRRRPPTIRQFILLRDAGVYRGDA